MNTRRSGRPSILAVSVFLLAPWLHPATAQLLGPEFQVNSYTTYNQSRPAVAATGSGNFVVTWSSDSQDGSYFGVFGQRFNSAGSPLGSEFQVNSYTTGYQFHPSVTAVGAGGFVVVWESVGQDHSGDKGVFGQRFDSAGVPVGSEFQVNTYTTNSQAYPAIAADSSGNFVVLWSSRDSLASYGVFGQRFSSAGSPVGSEFQVNTYTTGHQENPAVAVDGPGSFLVVWESDGQDGSNGGVFGQRFNSAGTKVGSEFRVNTYTTNSQEDPAVAVDGTGNFVVAWTSSGQASAYAYGVFGQRYSSAGSPAGSEFQVNSESFSNNRYPAVAANASGKFIVAWTGYDPNDKGVFEQQFDSSGGRLGSELRVNTYVTGPQEFPTAAASSVDNFVVSWQSDGQDGDGSGVFGQRLRAPLFQHGFEANPPFWSTTTTSMCSGFCGLTPDNICFCDELCLITRDCCLDACTTCGYCAP